MKALLTLGLWLPLAAADITIPGTDVALPMPPGWLLTPQAGAAVTVTAPDRRLRLAVVTQPLLANEGPAAFAQRCLADLQRLLPGVVLDDWRFADQRGDHAWSRVRYHFALGDADYHHVVWMTTSATTGLCITLGGAPGVDTTAQATRFEADLTGSRPIVR